MGRSHDWVVCPVIKIVVDKASSCDGAGVPGIVVDKASFCASDKIRWLGGGVPEALLIKDAVYEADDVVKYSALQRESSLVRVSRRLLGTDRGPQQVVRASS